MDNETFFPRTNLEWMPPGTITRLKANQVLVPELSEQVLNGHRDVRRRAGDTHVAASPSSQVVERCGLGRPTIARDLELSAGMIERRNHG
jgi:hypothetical protein